MMNSSPANMPSKCKPIIPELTLQLSPLWVLCFEYEMPPQAHVLNFWYSAGVTIFGGPGNFKRWDLTGGSRSLGVGSWGYLVLSLFLSLLSFPPPVHYEVNNLSLPYTPAAMMFCPSIWCQATMD
jgi:hypothetical protein